MDEKNGELLASRKTRLNEIGFIWNPTEAQWENRFNELLAYKSEYGHVNVPNDWPSGLGKWIQIQRVFEKNGKIAPDRRRRLIDIGFIWNTLDLQWDEKFDELIAYKAEYGNVDVPQRWATGLGAWLNTQRKAIKKDALSPERKARLDAIGVESDPLNSQWESMFDELLAYKAKHGTVNVPINGTSDLDAWVGRQRKAKKNGQLSSERIQRLEEIGFDWSPFASQWENMFTELLAYKVRYGNVNVPQRPRTALGRWVRVQRESVKNGRLTPDHKLKLDEVGFVWDLRSGT